MFGTWRIGIQCGRKSSREEHRAGCSRGLCPLWALGFHRLTYVFCASASCPGAPRGCTWRGRGWPLRLAALCRGAAWKQCGQAHSEPLHGARVPWRAGTRSLQSWAQHPKRKVKINNHGHQGPLRPISEFTSSMQTLFKKRRGSGRRRRNKKEEGRRRATLP